MGQMTESRPQETFIERAYRAFSKGFFSLEKRSYSITRLKRHSGKGFYRDPRKLAFARPGVKSPTVCLFLSY